MRATFVSAFAVAALLTLSSCGDDGSSQNGDASGLSVASVGDAGNVLVHDGAPVYTNEAEQGGKVECVQGCRDFWPPVLVDGDAPESVEGVDGTFGTVERPDGSTQVTLDDYPLYTFAEDEGTDAVKGDGFEDDFQGSHFVWHVVRASGDSGETDGDGGGYGGY